MITFCLVLGTGILLSLPVGPMGFTGSAQAADGHWVSARFLALGVCLGDGALAAFAIWGLAVPLESMKYVNMVILPCLAIYLWRRSNSVAIASPSGHASLMMGFVSTSFHPGNFLAFTLSFRWLHDNGFALRSLTEKLLMAPAVTCGALVVWGVFLSRSSKLGESSGFQKWRPLAFRAISVACLGLTVLQASDLSLSF